MSGSCPPRPPLRPNVTSHPVSSEDIMNVMIVVQIMFQWSRTGFTHRAPEPQSQPHRQHSCHSMSTKRMLVARRFYTWPASGTPSCLDHACVS